MLNHLCLLRLTLRTGRWRAVGNWRHLRYLALKPCPLLRTEKRKLLFGRLEIENWPVADTLWLWRWKGHNRQEDRGMRTNWWAEPSFLFLSVVAGDDHQHMPCFLSAYPATNGFAGTWDLRSNYHVSLIGAPIIPLFTPNTLVHNKQGKALILFLRRVDYPIHMEVVLYYCCVNCSISNNGKFECIQTLLVVIVHLIGLSNTLRFW